MMYVYQANFHMCTLMNVHFMGYAKSHTLDCKAKIGQSDGGIRSTFFTNIYFNNNYLIIQST